MNGQNDSSDTPKKETGPPQKKTTKKNKTKTKQNKLREDKFVVKEKWLHQN